MEAKAIYDRLERQFLGKVVYHLYSYSYRHQIVLKVDLPREEPWISNVEGVRMLWD